MTVYIASTEKNKGLIQEDIFIQKAFLSHGLVSKIETLENIVSKAIFGDVLFLKSIWGYHKDYKKFLEYISILKEKKVILVNDYEYIHWNINKSKYFSEIDFLKIIPAYKLDLSNVKSINDIEKIIKLITKDDPNNKFVIKPSIAASGYLACIYDKKDTVNNCISDILSHKDLDFMIQPFRFQIVEGEISIVLINGKIQYGIKRFPGIFTKKKEPKYIHTQEIPKQFIAQINLLLDFFINKFKSLPKICRVDFVKHGLDYELMEIELIDPDLFFRYIPDKILNKCLAELLDILKEISFIDQCINYMNKNTLKIKNELDKFGYGVIDYPESLKNTVSKLMKNFRSFCDQSLEHKQNLSYQNSMGYENRDKTINPESVDHKESFYIKAGYEMPKVFLPSKIDEAFMSSCKNLLDEAFELIMSTTEIFSEIAGVDLQKYFDSSALTLRAIHYYPDSSTEIAHHHVDRGGQTYHLFETTDGPEAYWHGKWNKIIFDQNQMIYFPCIQAQYASKCVLKGLCHRVVSNNDSIQHGWYSLVLFIDYNKLPHKYSMNKKGPIEKAFIPGQNYEMPFSELENYFEEKKQLFRKGVSALIMNDENEFLIVNLESFEPQFFAIPGGGVDSGETSEDAVYREIQEELSIPRDSLEFVGTCKEPLRLLFKTKKLNRDDVEYDGMEREFFGFRFVGDGSEIVLQPQEIRLYKWVSFSDLKNYLLFDNQLEDTSTKLLELFPSITN